jgi:hypothetical protein
MIEEFGGEDAAPADMAGDAAAWALLGRASSGKVDACLDALQISPADTAALAQWKSRHG